MDRPGYVENSPERCFFCKDELYTLLGQLTQIDGYDHVVDGCNLDDLGDHRPGRRAAAEHGVRSPLIEAGLTKDEIRALSKERGLPTWDKPAMACLSSRIPYGSPVTIEALDQIEAAETFLRSLGLRQLRVRHHGQVARIELDEGGMAVLMSGPAQRGGRALQGARLRLRDARPRRLPLRQHERRAQDKDGRPVTAETVSEVLATLAALRGESAKIVARMQFAMPRKERRELLKRFEVLRKQGKAITPRVLALNATATDPATRERLERDVYFLEQLRTFGLEKETQADA